MFLAGGQMMVKPKERVVRSVEAGEALEGVYEVRKGRRADKGVDGDNANQRCFWQGQMMVKPKE